jgi:hypothetical protein
MALGALARAGLVQAGRNSGAILVESTEPAMSQESQEYARSPELSDATAYETSIVEGDRR